MIYIDSAKKTLRTNSYKLTKSRILLIEALSKNNAPLNAYELTNEINRKIKKIDTVSVYRILALFKKLNLVHKTPEGKFIACQHPECNNPDHCHHQFVCTKCGEISEIHLKDSPLIKEITKKFPNISVTSHSLTLSGVCEECTKH